ncbi:hypothetical protein HPP92_024385 [Vanilla planifolia]|uniref:glucose-6-phosphate dehydrogenase (NADP(+)) n=1 Tax=Vanilla planifolia TaxID=51239 RepID=A0A835PV19_VANPL|nr:hypothetical protein HPP92_024385 [Vanilla planifolia]
MSTPSDGSNLGSINSSLKSKNTRNDSFSEEREVDAIVDSGCLSIVVLGASGDLAKKKTFPALYHLFRQGFLHSNEVHIFGYALTKISTEDLRDRLRGYLSKGNEDSTELDYLTKFLQLESLALFAFSKDIHV